jgi:hypothetical protein
MNYETSAEIEIAVSNFIGQRTHIIVPNVSWGMFPYELDLCVLNCKSFYAYEVEIKISKADLKRDSKKQHNHDWNHDYIRQLWFAMPEKMRGCEELVPTRAGIFYVTKGGRVIEERRAEINTVAKKWTVEKAYELARLATFRMWNLKRAEMYNKQRKV